MAPLPRADDRLFSSPSFLLGCNEKYNAPIDGDVRSRCSLCGARTRVPPPCVDRHRDEAGRVVSYRRSGPGTCFDRTSSNAAAGANRSWRAPSRPAVPGEAQCGFLIDADDWSLMAAAARHDGLRKPCSPASALRREPSRDERYGPLRILFVLMARTSCALL